METAIGDEGKEADGVGPGQENAHQRAAINRILDPANLSINLGTLEKAALALGKRWRFDLVDA